MKYPTKENFVSNLLSRSNLFFLILSLFFFQLIGCDQSSEGFTELQSGNGDCVISDFQMTLFPNTLSIPAGSSEIISIKSTIFYEYDACTFIDHSSFSISGQNPAGIILTRQWCYLDGQTLTSNFDSCTVMVSVPAGTQAGSYSIELLGTATLSYGRTSVDTKTLSIQIPSSPDFTLSPFSGNIGVAQGFSNPVTVNISRTNGHVEDIDLSLEFLPSNTNYAYDPNPVPGNENSSILTISPHLNAVPGDYNLRISGSDGNNEKIASLTLFIIEPYFISLTPDTVSITQGQQGTVQLGLNRIGIFTESVDLTTEGAIVGQDSVHIGTSFDPNPATGNSSTLTLTVGHAVPTGLYSITVEGIAENTLLKTNELQLNVIASKK